MQQYQAASYQWLWGKWTCSRNRFLRIVIRPSKLRTKRRHSFLWCSECQRERPAMLIREEVHFLSEMWNVHTVPKHLSFFELWNGPYPGWYLTLILPSERRCFAKWNATCYFTLQRQRFEARGNISQSSSEGKWLVSGVKKTIWLNL